MKIESAVKKRVILNYPGLDFKKSGSKTTIEGTFGFKATFNKKTNQYIINPQIIDDHTIIDNYEVRIEIPENDEFPIVFETAERIPSEPDFHKNGDGSLCLAGPFDCVADFPLDKFLDILLLQFLYDQSFKKKFNVWPRGEYSHGPLGLIENYYDKIGQIPKLEERCIMALAKNDKYKPYLNAITSKNQIKGHHLCICDSGIRYKNCHEKVFRGLWSLQRFVQNCRK